MMSAAETKTAAQPVPSAALDEPPVFWREIVQPVEPFLNAVLRRLEGQVQSFEPQIAPYAQYALTNQGKQLRPALVALCGDALRGYEEDLVTLAMIIEMVHLATLVHDDVMDAAEIRRQRPTLAVNWGNQLSVLLGDCLFARAVELASEYPTPEICRAVAAATNTVCTGEILQNQQRGNLNISRSDYLQVLEMKTGALFALSCEMGASLCERMSPFRADLARYGLALGTAYQLYDDCLDVFGSEKMAGKSLGTDMANAKWTLPVLLLLEQASPKHKNCLREMLQAWKPSSWQPFREMLDQYKILKEAQRVIHTHLGQARRDLSGLPVSISRTSLEGVTAFLARQIDTLG